MNNNQEQRTLNNLKKNKPSIVLPIINTVFSVIFLAGSIYCKIAFKEQYDGVIITKADLDKFLENDTPVRMKINQVIEQSKQNSKDSIAQSIMNGELSLYLTNDTYKVYGAKMNQKKDLYNSGFEFKETDSELHTKNFTMSKEDFEKTFSPQVIDYVEKFNKKKNYHKQLNESHTIEDNEQEMESA